MRALAMALVVVALVWNFVCVVSESGWLSAILTWVLATVIGVVVVFLIDVLA